MSEQEFQAYSQKWDQDFNNSAAEMIQSGFLIDTIAKKLELRWSQADVDKKLEEYTSQTHIDPARIREFYSKTEQMQRLTYMITEEKVLDFLISKAKINEVEKSKLTE